MLFKGDSWRVFLWFFSFQREKRSFYHWQLGSLTQVRHHFRKERKIFIWFSCCCPFFFFEIMNLLSLWISTEYKFGLLAISQLLIKIVHNKTANGLIWRRFTHKNSPVVSQVKPWKYTGNSMAQWIIKIIHMPSSSRCKDRGREQRKGVDKRLIKSQIVSHKTLGIEKKATKSQQDRTKE